MRIIIKKLTFTGFEKGDWVVRNPLTWEHGCEDWNMDGLQVAGRVLKTAGPECASKYTVLVKWIGTNKEWWYEPSSLRLVKRIKSEVDHEEEEKEQEGQGGLI